MTRRGALDLWRAAFFLAVLVVLLVLVRRIVPPGESVAGMAAAGLTGRAR